MPDSWNWANAKEYQIKARVRASDIHKAMGANKTFRERGMSFFGDLTSGALGSFHGRLLTGALVGSGIGSFSSQNNTETARVLDTLGGTVAGLGVAALTAPGLVTGLGKRLLVGGPRKNEYVVANKRFANKKFLGQLEAGREVARTSRGKILETAIPGAEGPELIRYLQRAPGKKGPKGRVIAGSRSHGSIIGKAAGGALKATKGLASFAINNPRAALLLGGIGLGMSALAGTRNWGSDIAPEQQQRYISSIGGTSRVNDELFMGSTEGLTLGLHKSRH